MPEKTVDLKLSAAQRDSFHNTIAQLSSSPDVEKAMETALNTVATQFFSYRGHPAVSSYPFDTDGVVTFGEPGLFSGEKSSSFRILIETKKGKDFSGDKKAVAHTLAQVIAYVRRFRDAGEQVPKVTIIADEDEIFYIPTALIAHYLDKDYQWDLAPSNMKKDTQLVVDLLEDSNITPYIRNMNVAHFNIEDFLQQVYGVALGDTELVKVPITVDTMTTLFMDFNHDVFGGVFDPVDNHSQLKLFYSVITGNTNLHVHPSKHRTLVLDGREFPLPSDNAARGFEAFRNRIDTRYTEEELQSLVAIFDQGLSDKIRRFHGDFFTPTLWVDKAHEVISSALGEDWRDKYVVVDPACGTKNLTRDYDFAELYSMTLHGEELDVAKDYNASNVAVQYDFLNDDVGLMHGDPRPVKGGKKALAEWEENRPTRQLIEFLNKNNALKMPKGLVDAMLDKKPIVFFANPPYGQNGNNHGSGEIKTGIGDTKIRGIMPANYGHAKQELYTQFVYRLQLLAQLFDYEEDFHFFFFNKGFLTSPSFGDFTRELTSQFSCKEGFMMNAGEFQGTSSAWGIIFSHWSIGGENQRSFDFDVLQSNKEKTEIEQAGSWSAHMVGKDNTISTWMNKELPPGKLDKKTTLTQFPLTKNGFDPYTAQSVKQSAYKGCIGSIAHDSSNVQKSEKFTAMFSMLTPSLSGNAITPDNIHRAAATFSVRRAVQQDIAAHNRLWIQDKDIFRAPSSVLGSDSTFLNDCLVYSLFDTQSRQTSLRDYQYKGNTYQVYNEFFPFSRDKIRDLAISAIKDEGLTQYRDVEVDISRNGKQGRLVCTLLEDARINGNLSKEAQTVLDNAWELIEHSFQSRYVHNSKHPRYQSMCWDAGWLSIRTMLWGRDRVGDDFLPLKEAWDKTLTTLGDKIAQRVYADGIIADPAAGEPISQEAEAPPESS